MVCELEKHWKIKKYWKIKTRGVKHIRKESIGRFRLWKINPMKLYFFSAKLEHSSKQLDVFSSDSNDKKLIGLSQLYSTLRQETVDQLSSLRSRLLSVFGFFAP